MVNIEEDEDDALTVTQLIKQLEALKQPDAKVYVSFDAGWGSGCASKVFVVKPNQRVRNFEEGDVVIEVDN